VRGVFQEAIGGGQRQNESGRSSRWRRRCSINDSTIKPGQQPSEDADVDGPMPSFESQKGHPGESPVIQVTGAGGGKSLSFRLPAYCVPGRVTVVVVPSVALQEDLIGGAKSWRSI
jgi:hypothetical protein